MRLAVPAFGTGLVAESRALFGALVLIPAALLLGQRIGPIAHWRDYLVVGLANNVLPFLCFAWAATVLPAGYMAVINGTVPLWTAIFSALILHERLRAARVVGFLLGLIGVGMIVNLGPLELSWRILAATAASLAGAALWGWAGVLIKQRYGRLPPMAVAAGSVAFAAAIMLPLWTQAPPLEAWTPVATANMVALGLLCTGFAYLPFEHAEDLAAQRSSLALFQALDPEHIGYARRHYEIIARFGRFPHRNAVLGRESTPEEIEFLKRPGSSF